MARHFRGSGHILRFIEYMDVGHTNGWRMDDVVPSAEVIRHHRPRSARSQPIDPNYPGEVAARWRYLDGGGEIGVISSVTQAFCSDCTRARLATDGKLYTCLFATSGVRPARAAARRRHRRRDRQPSSRRSGRSAPTAIRKSAPTTPRAAEDRDELHRRLSGKPRRRRRMHLPALIEFLRGWSRTTIGPWFAWNKPAYDVLREEFQALVGDVAARVAKFDRALGPVDPQEGDVPHLSRHALFQGQARRTRRTSARR